MPKNYERFGEHVKALRETAGLTRQQAANRTGLTLKEWIAIEQDDVPPKLRLLRVMAHVLGVAPSEVF
jgi:DNA-binding XRE family transcriptional regulator